MELDEIIEKCKNGERHAQSLLYKRYSQQMLRICYRLVADKQVAQDLMHDGFIIIFTSINSLHQPEKIEGWMGRIMTNLALRYINQTRSVPIVPLSDLPEEQEPTEEEPLPDLLPLEKLLIIVDELPDGYRNVFKLSVLDGLSHKEIAEILHIAPHSSSSQFYRAKEYLKKMIVQYSFQLLLLLVMLLFPVGYLLLLKDTKKVSSPQGTAMVKESNRDRIDVMPDNPVPACKVSSSRHVIVTEVVSPSPSTVNQHSEEVVMDTVESSLIKNEPKVEMWSQGKNRTENRISSFSNRSGWVLTFEYSGGKTTTDILSKNIETPVNGDISSGHIPSYANNWNDYYQYLRQYGHMLEDQREVQSLMDIAQRNSGKIVERKRHYLPITIGVRLNKSLDKHWGIETGLNYTRLVSDFKTGDNAFIYERQKLHYIGIPLRGTYLFGKFKQFSIYSSAGVTLEIPVSATLRTDYVMDDKVDFSKRHALDAPLQWSVNSGLGIQYQRTSSVGFFAEPVFHYYFKDGSGLRTNRKDHPVIFSLPIGVRFSY